MRSALCDETVVLGSKLCRSGSRSRYMVYLPIHPLSSCNWVKIGKTKIYILRALKYLSIHPLSSCNWVKIGKTYFLHSEGLKIRLHNNLHGHATRSKQETQIFYMFMHLGLNDLLIQYCNSISRRALGRSKTEKIQFLLFLI